MKNENLPPYRLWNRKGVWYACNRQTAKPQSLQTRNESEAHERLNVLNRGAVGRQEARAKMGFWAKMAGYDHTDKTWQDAMDSCAGRSHLDPATSKRLASCFRSKRFDKLRIKRICETLPDDLDELLACGKPSIVKNLRTLHTEAVRRRLLYSPLIHPRQVRVMRLKDPRATTIEEHQRIMDRAKTEERRLYYQLLWHTGASQSDCANFRAEDFCKVRRDLHYNRAKTANECRLEFTQEVFALLDQLPKRGFLFPSIQKESESQRGTVFRRACGSLQINGITLHSYRYAFAERCRLNGITVEEAMAAMGLKSFAVYHSYAKGAKIICRPVDSEVLEAAA